MRTWSEARNPQWEHTVWKRGYAMCGWPEWFCRLVIWWDRVKRMAGLKGS